MADSRRAQGSLRGERCIMEPWGKGKRALAVTARIRWLSQAGADHWGAAAVQVNASIDVEAEDSRPRI
jgi:hypothetical protein